VFPVLTSTLRYSPDGLAAVTDNEGATATVKAFEEFIEVHLVIPSVNLSGTVRIMDPDPSVVLGEFSTAYFSTAYSSRGIISWFGLGYETPASALPTGGQAMFSGSVAGHLYAARDGRILSTDKWGYWSGLIGDAALTADFASGHITGAFTNMTYREEAGGYGSTPRLPWNDIAVSATIAAGTNKFSGTTSVTSAPTNALSLKPSATGTIDGAMFGPHGESLGALWSLSDGTTSAIGSVSAKQAVPSAP
jgi:hypothetical protein